MSKNMLHYFEESLELFIRGINKGKNKQIARQFLNPFFTDFIIYNFLPLNLTSSVISSFKTTVIICPFNDTNDVVLTSTESLAPGN